MSGERPPVSTEHDRPPPADADAASVGTPAPRAVRLAFADDSYLIRAAVEPLLRAMPRVELRAVCSDGDALLEAALSEPLDVVLTDLRMPPSGDAEGTRVSRTLARERPAVGVIVLSQVGSRSAARSVFEDDCRGGRGYLLKDHLHDAEQLEASILAVAGGESVFDPSVVRHLLADGRERRDSRLHELTPRETQVLEAMSQGLSNGAIAGRLVLTVRAVEKHVRAIFSKLGLSADPDSSRRVAAVLLYLDRDASESFRGPLG